jgi:hypothetical protein
MQLHVPSGIDLMPPPFAEGLDDWSRGDGTPESPTWETAENARLARGDPDFGVCLELRTVAPVERVRYMGEVPLTAGACIEIGARLKAVRGPLPRVRIAAWPGGAQGRAVSGLRTEAADVDLPGHDLALDLAAVIGTEPLAGVDLVWDYRVRYAHVGLDIVGATGAVVRVGVIAVREVTARVADGGRRLPGFGGR